MCGRKEREKESYSSLGKLWIEKDRRDRQKIILENINLREKRERKLIEKAGEKVQEKLPRDREADKT